MQTNIADSWWKKIFATQLELIAYDIRNNFVAL